MSKKKKAAPAVNTKAVAAAVTPVTHSELEALAAQELGLSPDADHGDEAREAMDETPVRVCIHLLPAAQAAALLDVLPASNLEVSAAQVLQLTEHGQALLAFALDDLHYACQQAAAGGEVVPDLRVVLDAIPASRAVALVGVCGADVEKIVGGSDAALDEHPVLIEALRTVSAALSEAGL